ncbi:MAG: ATP-binding protein [Euryarchaeota archaeon]|nr:ATP-binding protein [Euryarchaeota archaeon]
MLLDSKNPVTNLRALLFEEGLAGSEEEYRSLLHEITIRLAREEILSSAQDDDEVIHAVRALDDLNNILNLLSERLFEWYSLYRSSPPSEELARRIIEEEGIPDVMRTIARNLIDLYDSRRMLIDHIQDEMIKIAPNLTNLAGALLAARLISIAGGLEKLCRMPASRVQVLGANRAMFRHLRGASPPKHGAIYQHPCIHASPYRLRGRIARAFASKLVIAARIDYYSGTVQEGLVERLTDRIEEIRRKQE